MMRRALKTFIFAFLAIGAVQSARSFSLLGPLETWQDAVLDYAPPSKANIGGPHSLGEEFRWNAPNLTYGFDFSFLEWFGSNGVRAVEEAFQLVNDVPSATEMSKSLREFPLDTRRENFRATALNLIDLKSQALHFIVEEMGLASPETYVWTLRSETHLGTTPPTLAFLVIRRNYDPETLEPSSYVNDVLYTYDLIHSPSNPHLADALESAVDPFALSFSSIAYEFVTPGLFFTGLTRDDVGGLRYLLNPNNVNVETLPPALTATATIQPVPFTNTSTLVAVPSVDLLTFSNQALTNSTAQLVGLYPDLSFTNTNTFFTNIVVSNVTYFFTNAPWAPAGSFPVIATNAIFTTNVVPRFRYVFDNVLTNHFSPNCLVLVEENDVVPSPYDPRFNPFLTNLTQRLVISNNCPSGDILIVPTNLFGYEIVGTQLATVTPTTNVIFDLFDPFTGLERKLDVVTFATNYTYLAYPIEKLVSTNTTVARPGRNRLHFNRVDFDSLLGQFVAFTNTFIDQFITNSTLASQTVERIVAGPDFIFTAEDLGEVQSVPVLAARSSNWQDNTALNGIVSNPQNNTGPGQITPGVVITFNKLLAGSVTLGPYIDPSPGSLFIRNAELSAATIINPTWASFDATTNPPVIYPVGTSIEALEKLILNRP